MRAMYRNGRIELWKQKAWRRWYWPWNLKTVQALVSAESYSLERGAGLRLEQSGERWLVYVQKPDGQSKLVKKW